MASLHHVVALSRCKIVRYHENESECEKSFVSVDPRCSQSAVSLQSTFCARIKTKQKIYSNIISILV